MRVLVLENDPARLPWFERTYGQVVWVQTVPQAIAALEDALYDYLYLDHDLDTEPAVGRDVAAWLIRHPHVQPGVRTICHSVNTVSGPKIARELTAAGRPAVWVPYFDLVNLVLPWRAPAP